MDIDERLIAPRSQREHDAVRETLKEVGARAIMEQQSFGVGILTAEQIEIANRGAAPGQPKFIDELVSEESAMGSPSIRRTLANIHCELYNAVNVGDHVVFIGEVGEVGLGAERAPLVYFDRELRGLGAGYEMQPGGIDVDGR